MSEDVSRLRDLIASVSKRFGIDNPAATGALWVGWRDIVGTSIAEHGEPTSLRDGILRVRADSPAWATELTYLVDDIKARANEAVGTELVREVRIWTGPSARSRPASSATTEAEAVAPLTAPTPRLREAPADPLEALQRARRAWSKRRS